MKTTTTTVMTTMMMKEPIQSESSYDGSIGRSSSSGSKFSIPLLLPLPLLLPSHSKHCCPTTFNTPFSPSSLAWRRGVSPLYVPSYLQLGNITLPLNREKKRSGEKSAERTAVHEREKERRVRLETTVTATTTATLTAVIAT